MGAVLSKVEVYEGETGIELFWIKGNIEHATKFH